MTAFVTGDVAARLGAAGLAYCARRLMVATPAPGGFV